MTLVRFLFYSSTLVSGTYDLDSLPFLLLHSRFGHIWTRFVTVFTPPLSFRARMTLVRYRFYSSALISGRIDSVRTIFTPPLSFRARMTSVRFLFYSFRSCFGNVSTRFVTIFTPPLSFRARMTSVRFLFYFLRSRFGHVSGLGSLLVLISPLSFRQNSLTNKTLLLQITVKVLQVYYKQTLWILYRMKVK